MNESQESGATAVLAPPDEIEKADSISAGALGGDDVSSAPEEESDSEIPNDPRPPHALQPPTKEEY